MPASAGGNQDSSMAYAVILGKKCWMILKCHKASETYLECIGRTQCRRRFRMTECVRSSVRIRKSGAATSLWHRTAMSSVKLDRSDFVFFLKAVFVFSFRSGFGGRKRFPGGGSGLGHCSSCYPCTALPGRHQLTHTVIARKRARPISKSGRDRPQCGCGRAPFQIIPVGLQHGDKVGLLGADHLPA